MILPNYPWIKYKHIACSVYSCKFASHNFTPTISGHALGRSTAGLIRRLTFIDNPIKLQLTADIHKIARTINSWLRSIFICMCQRRKVINERKLSKRWEQCFFLLSSWPQVSISIPYFTFLLSFPSPSPTLYSAASVCMYDGIGMYIRTNLEPSNDYMNKKATQLWWRWQR